MSENLLGGKKRLSKKSIALICTFAVLIVLLIVAIVTKSAETILNCPTCDGTGTYLGDSCPKCDGEVGFIKHIGSIWALLPPIIAITLALITKEVFSSLFVGMLSGSILAATTTSSGIGEVLKGSMDNLVGTGLIDAVAGTAGIFIFLIELGIIVALINKAGGSKAFGEWAQTHIKTKIGAGLATFFLGVLIFIDDYFNCLTVGSVMRPVTDKHKISRSKLAYIIDATAAPICMIAPISSWAAAVNNYIEGGEGLKFFIMAIPFNFYSILTIVFVISIILLKFDFGPMRKHEINALNGDLFSGRKVANDESAPSSKGKVFDLLFPVITLIVVCIVSLFITGIDETHTDFISAISNTDATVALPWGGLISLIIIMAYLVIRKTVSFKETMDAIPKGFIAMVPAILILTFATALKNITGLLGADYYVGNLIKNSAGGFVNFLPFIVYLVACILSFATGTSWGTFGILIPIVTSMFTPDNPFMIVCMSACLAGAVCGDHCSPISDTTIMSSAGAECEHINHVSTQLPYALFVAGISGICFLIAGFVPLWYVMLPLSIAIMVGSVLLLKLILTKLEKKNVLK